MANDRNGPVLAESEADWLRYSHLWFRMPVKWSMNIIGSQSGRGQRPLCAMSVNQGHFDTLTVNLLSSMLMIKSSGKIISLVCLSSSNVHQ